MTTDINERIARLVSPEPKQIGTVYCPEERDDVPVYEERDETLFRLAWKFNLPSPAVARRGQSYPGSFSMDGTHVAMPFTESLDASMAVIAAKFDVLSSVELFVECDRSGTVTNRCATLNTNCGDVFVGRADTYAHALAIALLAALEAEQ